MNRQSLGPVTLPILSLFLLLLPIACSNGSDGATGPAGPAGPPGGSAINASTTSPTQLAELDIVSEIASVTIASPPVVRFTMATAAGVPIVGLVPFWESNSRFIRFTITKLVPGENGDPDSWVPYVLDNGEPDYDTGASLVDNEDGSYTFTFNTDITNVAGVTYEPTLTHRVAGQIGQLSTVPIEEQNVWFDFVPDGSAVTRTRNIAVMTSCNECHTNLVFHGRRFEVEYCVQCHNPSLAEGEGDFSFMIHRIHDAGEFNVLNGGQSFAEVTYPQDVRNCRKCHNADDTATAQADNWRNVPTIAGCSGCHDVFGANANLHTGGVFTDNSRCTECHAPSTIVEYHTLPNATPNNPELLDGQRDIAYEMIDASVEVMTNEVTVRFKLLSDGTPLDVTDLPADLKNGMGVPFRYPGFLLAWAQPQGLVTDPVDFNNLGRASAQPLSLGLNSFGPISMSPIGTLSYNAGDGVTTAVITSMGSQFPVGATLRTVGLQGYFQQDLTGNGSSDVSLHALSVVVPVTGDAVRRQVIDTNKCAQCHEWFEGHGGNRLFGQGSDMICSTCHVPNLSSSGRTLDLMHPEDSQNLKDMIHGIHSSGFRTRDYEHVRNFNNSARFYNWSEVTFPRGASTSDCKLCHLDGTYELPLRDGVLPTTVRTTSMNDGMDPSTGAVTTARGGAALPNATDWINTPTASSCFYCHTSTNSWAHMVQNGAQLSDPQTGGPVTNRSGLGTTFEACSVCHGSGKIADIEVVHNR